MVTDFRRNKGDRLVISKDAFEGVVKVKLEAVIGRAEVNAAASSNRNFIYNEKNGLLYFNENGKQRGFGDGGEFVKLLGAPEIGKSDLALI